MAQGAALLALSMYWLGDINLFIALGNLLWPIILSGFAVAAIFVAITIFSVATVSRQQMVDATGLTNRLRNLGGSVGISLPTKPHRRPSGQGVDPGSDCRCRPRSY
jgi:DHA2 family multidrug resistance protein